MAISHITGGEAGASSRGKVNKAIDQINLPRFGDLDMGDLKGITVDPRLASSTRTLVAGTLLCVKARPRPGVSITQLIYNISTALAGGTGFAIQFAIFDETGAQLSVTSNIAASTPFGLGEKTITIPGFTRDEDDGSIIIAILIGSGGTSPTTFPVLNSGPGAVTGLKWGQDGSKGYPYFAYGSGLTAMPASLTLNSTNCTIAAPAQSVVLIGLN